MIDISKIDQEEYKAKKVAIYNKFMEQSKLNGFITNPLRTDGGAGEVIKTVMFSIVVAEFCGLPFYYTPVEFIEHNYEDDPDYINKIEEMVGFIRGYPVNEDKEKQYGFDEADVVADLVYSNYQLFRDSVAYKEMKVLFRVGKKYEDYYDRKYFNVAVHLRRGNPWDNAKKDEFFEFRMRTYTDEYYLAVLKYVVAKYNRDNLLLHVYSQDLDINKYDLPGIKIQFHLYEDLVKMFPAMVFADVLVIGASSLSYMAGLLREEDEITHRIKYCYPSIPWIPDI